MDGPDSVGSAPRTRSRRRIWSLLAVALGYLGLGLLAFPITEVLGRGPQAIQFARDVLDDGSVARLAALPAEWREHGFVLWNPYLAGGNAWYGQFVFPPLAPDTLLAFLTSPETALLLMQVSLAWGAGVSMHVFVRYSLRLPVAAAVAGATVYLFSFWHYPQGLVVPLLPALLLLADRPRGRWRWQAWLAAAVIGAIVLHQGLVQTAILAVFLQLTWLVWVHRSAPDLRERLTDWASAWAAAAAVYAPALLTLAAGLVGSHRSEFDLSASGIADPMASLTSVIGAYSAVAVVLPTAAGLGEAPLGHGTFFLGMLALPLLLVGLRNGFATRRGRWLLALAVMIPAVDFVAHLGGGVIEELPVLGSFQLTRVRHFLPFVTAAIVAVGAGRVASWPRGAPRRRLDMALLAAGAVVVAIQLPRAAAELAGATDLAEFVVAGGISTAWLVSSIAGAAALGLVVAARLHPGRTAGLLLIGVLLIGLVTERASFARIERALTPTGLGTLTAYLARTPIEAVLQAEQAPGGQRALAMGGNPNRLLWHRIRGAGGYQNVYPAPWKHLFGALIRPELDRDPRRAAAFDDWGNRATIYTPAWNRAVLDLLAVRWVISDRRLDEPGLTELETAPGRRLYVNAEAFPRAFVVFRRAAFDDRGAMLRALADASSDELRSTAFVHGDVGASLGGGGAGSASVSTAGPDGMLIRVETDGPGLLIVSDVVAPGWEASVDETPAPIQAAYGALRAIEVPAGDSLVQLSYRPWFTHAGFGFAALGLIAGSVRVLVLRSRQRSARLTAPVRRHG